MVRPFQAARGGPRFRSSCDRAHGRYRRRLMKTILLISLLMLMSGAACEKTIREADRRKHASDASAAREKPQSLAALRFPGRHA